MLQQGHAQTTEAQVTKQTLATRSGLAHICDCFRLACMSRTVFPSSRPHAQQDLILHPHEHAGFGHFSGATSSVPQWRFQFSGALANWWQCTRTLETESMNTHMLVAASPLEVLLLPCTRASGSQGPAVKLSFFPTIASPPAAQCLGV